MPVIALALLACGTAIAQPRTGATPASAGTASCPPALATPRHVVAGGGGTSSGGVFMVRGTIGQPDADPLQPSTGGRFAVTGGFWPGVRPSAPRPEALFDDGFEPGGP